MSITIFGSINIDLTTYAERLPQAGETLHGQRYGTGLGGKGCNQAVACARLGGETTLVGRVGNDNFGDMALEVLRDFAVPIDHVHVDKDSDTGIAVIGVDASAENCITVIGGANMAIGMEDVTRADNVFKNTDILLLQLEIPMQAGLAAADIVRANGGKVIFDPAPAPSEGLSDDVFQHIDVITPNETETQLLTGMKPETFAEAAEAARALRARGVGIAVVKLGAKGVYYLSDNEEGFVTPFEVTSVDSVAAGDCFNGGLAYAMSKGKSVGEAVRFAAACGALSTTRKGAAPSAPTLAEVEALLEAQ